MELNGVLAILSVGISGIILLMAFYGFDTLYRRATITITPIRKISVGVFLVVATAMLIATVAVASMAYTDFAIRNNAPEIVLIIGAGAMAIAGLIMACCLLFLLYCLVANVFWGMEVGL
ncbi:MAG: hypothetical protein WD467_02260 [Candidatus Saccharimonadales bacterium]